MAQVDQQIAALQAEIIRMNGELTAQAAAVAQAQAGAAAAAQVQGARAAQTATAQAFSPLIDTRMLTKPRSFNGKEEDWSQFATVTRAYCGALDPRLYNEMEEAAQQTVPVLNANLPDPAKQHRSQTIYYLLVMLVEGRAMSMAENCKCGEGFELWRKLTETYEPKAGTRAAGLLVRILTVDFDMQDFLSSLEKWEYLIKQYDHMVGGIDDLQDRVKIATLVSRMGKGVVQDHFLVNVSKYTKYEDLRKDLVDFLSAKKHLGGTGGDSQSHNGPAPMEIGQMVNGKWQKGGKGGGAKGKGKGKDITCHHCGKPGHVKKDCWVLQGGGATAAATSPKVDKGGKGKGKGGGKDKGGKGGATCHRCGKAGHIKKDCRSVRHKDGTYLSSLEENTEPEGEHKAAGDLSGLVYLAAVSFQDTAGEIHAIEQTRRVNIGVDSGAAASVWPRALCADYPTKQTNKSGVKYATAGKDNKHLTNEGERTMMLMMGDGSARGAKMQVTDVRKPLMSVADMNDAGQDVHFLAAGQSYAVHRETGLVTTFTRTKNIFEINAEVPPYKSSFHGPHTG